MKKDFLSRSDGSKTFIFIKGALIGVAVTLIMMLLFAVIMYAVSLERALAAPLATVSLAVGTFFAAFYVAAKMGNKGYLIGLITGIAVFAAITLVSLLIDRSGLTLNTLFHFIIIMLSSFIGGVVGVNKGKNKKYI